MRRERPFFRRLCTGCGLDDLPDLEAVALGESEVAFVVRGHRHDRAGSVLHQDVIGHPDRDALVIDRVHDVAPGEHTVLLLRLALDGRPRPGVPDIVEDFGFVLRSFDQPRYEWMLGREHEEGCAEERVGARREDLDLVPEVVHSKEHVGALGPADPVPLHRQHTLGPLLEQRHLVEEHVGVVGDLEEPLLEVSSLDLGAAALAPPVDHLLVREHRLIVRAPLDRSILPVREALLEEAEEEPLRPAVVLGLVRGEDAIPVDRPAHAFHLRADRGDVPRSFVAGVRALLDRGVLRGQAERVEPHRAHYGEAVATAEVGDDLAQHVVADVPHVQVARRVREHLEHVGLLRVALELLAVRIRHLEGSLVLPDALPLLFDRSWVVLLHRRSCSPQTTKKPLAREASEERPRLSPRPLPALWKKLHHLRKG